MGPSAGTGGEAAAARWRGLREHPDAPPWSHDIGDRLVAGDLAAVEVFRASLGRVARGFEDTPLERWRATVPWLEREEPTSSRADLATRVHLFVPTDADLDRMIRYDTAGTSGVALPIPSHPVATACSWVLIEEALRRWGIALDRGPDLVVAHVNAQRRTWTFASSISQWGGAGFVKVNLQAGAWSPARARAFFADVKPQLVTGDPVSFAEMLGWDLPVRPRALISTATTLSPAFAAELAARCGCPVIDWYSTTETGPVAATSPRGLELLCPDLFVEIVDAEGRALPEGERGEVCVTGGRNPSLALVRYRTGDSAALRDGVLEGFVGRRPVWWRAGDGCPVTPVDLAHVLHTTPVAAFSFGPAGGGFELRVRPTARTDVERLREGFAAMLKAEVRVVIDEALGGDGKAEEWRG
ncbi:MAG: AMP-binding protein [Myxococcota bacterium]